MGLKQLYQGMTTAEREALAEKAGISPGFLWQFVTGWNGKRPSLDTLKKLADADPRLRLGELAVEFSEPVKAA